MNDLGLIRLSSTTSFIHFHDRDSDEASSFYTPSNEWWGQWTESRDDFSTLLAHQEREKLNLSDMCLRENDDFY